MLSIDRLSDRREQLSLDFALKCVRNPKTASMFPLNRKTHDMETRNPGKYEVQHANNERLKNSAIIYMQNLLNTYEEIQLDTHDEGQMLKIHENIPQF